MKVTRVSCFSPRPLDWSAEMRQAPSVDGVRHYPAKEDDRDSEQDEFEKDCYALLDKWGIEEIFYMRKTRICGVNVPCRCFDKVKG